MIVGACGTFDYKIHEGHLQFFNWAKTFGDVTVFIVPDDIVIRNKGRRPYYLQKRRSEMVLPFVNRVEVLSNNTEENHQQIMDKIDVYLFGFDQFTEWDILLEKKLNKEKIACFRSTLEFVTSTTQLLQRVNILRELII